MFFQYPNPDTVIRCFESCTASAEKYPPITVAEHYLGKLMKAGHSRLDADAKAGEGVPQGKALARGVAEAKALLHGSP